MNTRKEGMKIKEEIYRYIVRCIEKHVYQPNIKEIMDDLSISTTKAKRRMDELMTMEFLGQMRNREHKERSGSKIQR